MRRIAILGSTGSIGVSALDVIARHPDRYAVVALAANVQWQRLFEQCVRFGPRVAALLDDGAACQLRAALRGACVPTEVLSGADGVEAIGEMQDADTVIAGIVGAAGLSSTIAAARRGKRILLANKETLVLAGEWFMRTARENGATVLPVDSEHNAIFQCLPADYLRAGRTGEVRRLILTASGGPFRTAPLSMLPSVSPAQACAHPNWTMGRKISVDSATMMNKGLEVIEAHWLFGIPPERIEVVIHPQSIVHSLVEFADGSQLAQLGMPDMRTPIAHALAYPERIEAGVERLDLAAIGRLEFTAPDYDRFPCLRLGFEALSAGGSAPGTLNAANEIAVAAFLAERLRYTDIPHVCEETLARMNVTPLEDLEAVIECDAMARQLARECAMRLTNRSTIQ
jgi:1-deoxy-D-xylulose-5-phosphate reductoisomerase